MLSCGSQYNITSLNSTLKPVISVMVGPRDCQWISPVGQQQSSEITDRDRQAREGRKYLFMVVNDAELGDLGGIH